MDKEYNKEDDNSIGVIETKPEEVLPKRVYDYGFLKKQLIAIQEQKDRDDAQRDKEIAEVELLLSEADKLGIVEKPTVEPIIEAQI